MDRVSYQCCAGDGAKLVDYEKQKLKEIEGAAVQQYDGQNSEDGWTWFSRPSVSTLAPLASASATAFSTTRPTAYRPCLDRYCIQSNVSRTHTHTHVCVYVTC